MSVNFTLALTGLEKILSAPKLYWTRKTGLVITIIIVFVVLYVLWDKIGFENCFAWLRTSAAFAIALVVVWLISSKRLLFRNAGLALLWVGIALALSLIYYLQIVPRCHGSVLFVAPAFRVWTSIAVFVLFIFFGYLVDCHFLKEELMIVFAVNNESVELERVIRASITPVVQKIQDADQNVRLIVMPFGVIKSARQGQRYITQPWTRADALIFASVIDDGGSNSLGYVFTDFSSRINERRFVKEDNRAVPGTVLNAHLRCRDWNYLNLGPDNCSRKIAVSENLEDMLRMYIGCIYLMKHNSQSALPYTENAIYKENRSTPIYRLAAVLFSYACITSAKDLEVNKEYDSAYMILNRLNETMPIVKNNPGYNQAMARMMFYKNDIQKSEIYTKKIKGLPNCEWGYELNMGFYSIYKKKPAEFVHHYKKLRKFTPQKEQVEFAIAFLDTQDKETNDEKYRSLLRTAIAFLHLYKNPRKARMKVRKVVYQQMDIKSIKAIGDLKSIIENTTKRFPVARRIGK